jgi:predicted MFS family arabinose efflux permease
MSRRASAWPVDVLPFPSVIRLGRQAWLAPVLVLTSTVTAIISSLGAPLVPRISDELAVPLAPAQWSLTAALLTGAVSAPILGRLGDGRRRRETLVGGLAAVALGGILAALAPNLALLVTGRALQGIGLGLVPILIAAARDHLPPERAPATISLLAVAAAAGAGAGYPISGYIADEAGVTAAFWFGAGFSGVAFLCVLLVVPSSASRAPSRLDAPGAALLTAGLVALLLAIAQGEAWGWNSARVSALLVAAVVILGCWVVQQLHVRAPLIELRLLSRPAVLAADGCAIVLGIAMYIYISAVTAYVQTPRETGYGFSASVVLAGLCLVPFSVFSIVASRMLPWVTRVVGPRLLLPLGSLVVAAGGAFFAVLQSALWQAFGMMAIVGIGFGLTFAAIPGIIVRAVPECETGSAMGFYQVVRYIGFSLGSAVTGSVLAGYTQPSQQLPTEAGYRMVLWLAVGICVAAAALAWVLPVRGERRRNRPHRRQEQDEAEAGRAGLVA